MHRGTDHTATGTNAPANWSLHCLLLHTTQCTVSTKANSLWCNQTDEPEPREHITSRKNTTRVACSSLKKASPGATVPRAAHTMSTNCRMGTPACTQDGHASMHTGWARQHAHSAAKEGSRQRDAKPLCPWGPCMHAYSNNTNTAITRRHAHWQRRQLVSSTLPNGAKSKSATTSELEVGKGRGWVREAPGLAPYPYLPKGAIGQRMSLT
jgi:hypothetical protein